MKLWPQKLLPNRDFHKLEGEVMDEVDTFTGHKDYRPDCITRSGIWGPVEQSFTFENDANAWIDARSYGLPGDFHEDAGY
jgi:hypothetical protein